LVWPSSTFSSAGVSSALTIEDYADAQWHFGGARTVAVYATRTGAAPGTVTGSFNYLPMREAYNYTNQSLLNLLIAFGVFALAASLATIVNLVLGTVLASYREIGILKALGFTPAQVVAALVVGMAIPALIGCAIGIPAGAALSLPLVERAAESLGLSAQSGVSPVASLLALVSILGCVTVAAALPALRAGRMSAD